MEILAPCPITPIWLRNEFLFNQSKGHREFTEGYLVAVRAVMGRVLSFQVQLINGAQWANVPLHMLTVQEGAPLLDVRACAWWDCFSDDLAVVELPLLRGITAECRDRNGTVRNGSYLFTVDWKGHWAAIPDQHKQHHIIALDSGQLLAYPNNKIIFRDASWYTPMSGPPGYLANSHTWHAEGNEVLADPTQRDYAVAPAGAPAARPATGKMRR